MSEIKIKRYKGKPNVPTSKMAKLQLNLNISFTITNATILLDSKNSSWTYEVYFELRAHVYGEGNSFQKVFDYC